MTSNHSCGRREFLAGAAAAATSFAVFTASKSARAAGAPSEPPKLTPPSDGKINVAFAITGGANVMDIAGPWEVFADVMLGKENGVHKMPFRLYTVSETREPLKIGGGMMVTANYTFEDVPPSQIIVVPAQIGSDKLHEWLRKASATSHVTMSVCTGAFQLGKAGLLDGKAATTHHEAFDKFASVYPKVELKRGLRFVDNGSIATAGGLTSGIDLALHIVDRYYGPEIAKATAEHMEYQSERWH